MPYNKTHNFSTETNHAAFKNNTGFITHSEHVVIVHHQLGQFHPAPSIRIARCQSDWRLHEGDFGRLDSRMGASFRIWLRQ